MSDKHRVDSKARAVTKATSLLAVFEVDAEQWQIVSLHRRMTVDESKTCWRIKISAEGEFQFYDAIVLNGGKGAPEDFNLTPSIIVKSQPELSGRQEATADDFRADPSGHNRVLSPSSATIQFALQGRHPFFGMMVIEDLFKLIYRHNMMHARDIRKRWNRSNVEQASPCLFGHDIGCATHGC